MSSSFLPKAISPHPITVTRHSHTTFGASYSISLVDTKSPPPTNFSNLPIVFTSSTAHQKLVVLVSYTGITKVETPSCPVPPNETIGTKKAGPQMLLDDQQWYIFMGVATLILVLAVTVICPSTEAVLLQAQWWLCLAFTPSCQSLHSRLHSSTLHP